MRWSMRYYRANLMVMCHWQNEWSGSFSTQGSIGGAKGQAVMGAGPGSASLETAARGSGCQLLLKWIEAVHGPFRFII